LSKDKAKSIAVIGPNAAEPQLEHTAAGLMFSCTARGNCSKAAALGIKVEYSLGCVVDGRSLRPIEPNTSAKLKEQQNRHEGEYFDNMNLTGKPVITRVDSMVNFNFGTGSPAPGVPEDHFLFAGGAR